MTMSSYRIECTRNIWLRLTREKRCNPENKLGKVKRCKKETRELKPMQDCDVIAYVKKVVHIGGKIKNGIAKAAQQAWERFRFQRFSHPWTCKS